MYECNVHVDNVLTCGEFCSFADSNILKETAGYNTVCGGIYVHVCMTVCEYPIYQERIINLLL